MLPTASSVTGRNRLFRRPLRSPFVLGWSWFLPWGGDPKPGPHRTECPQVAHALPSGDFGVVGARPRWWPAAAPPSL